MKHRTVFLALAFLVALFTTPTLALWVQDCDARPDTHCLHGPAGGTMTNGGAIYFDMKGGSVLEGHPGTVNNTAYLLSELSTGTIKFSCKLGFGPSSYRFSLGPRYSFVEATGPYGDLSRAQIIGSSILLYAINLGPLCARQGTFDHFVVDGQQCGNFNYGLSNRFWDPLS